MAQSGDVLPPSGAETSNWYCHICESYTEPSQPDFTCTRCHSGFIEQIMQANAIQGSQGSVGPVPVSLLARLAARANSQPYSPGRRRVFRHGHITVHHLQPGANPSNSLREFIDQVMATAMGVDPSQSGSTQQPGASALSIVVTPMLLTAGGQVPEFLAAGASVSPAGMPTSPGSLNTSLGGSPGGPQLPSFLPDAGHFITLSANNLRGLDDVITMLLNQLDHAATGAPPATKAQIDSLTTISISQQQVDECVECSICKENLTLTDDVRSLPCKHIFHMECISRWLQLHGTCPVCRFPIHNIRLSASAAAAAAAADAAAADVIAAGVPATPPASAAEPRL